jgi:hypothetical protein
MSAGKQKGAVGRRPEEYDINTADNFIIGIDFQYRSEYNRIRQFAKLEFGGQCPLTMRHELRRSNEIISRLVASSRSAHGIRQT